MKGSVIGSNVARIDTVASLPSIASARLVGTWLSSGTRGSTLHRLRLHQVDVNLGDTGTLPTKRSAGASSVVHIEVGGDPQSTIRYTAIELFMQFSQQKAHLNSSIWLCQLNESSYAWGCHSADVLQTTVRSNVTSPGYYVVVESWLDDEKTALLSTTTVIILSSTLGGSSALAVVTCVILRGLQRRRAQATSAKLHRISVDSSALSASQLKGDGPETIGEVPVASEHEVGSRPLSFLGETLVPRPSPSVSTADDFGWFHAPSEGTLQLEEQSQMSGFSFDSIS